jgi:hypothetical protein
MSLSSSHQKHKMTKATSNTTETITPCKIAVGTKVLVRTYSAGVHFGIMVGGNQQMVHLRNAKRIWNWNGAMTLSEIATTGVDLTKSKISVSVDEIILPSTIEIIKVSKTSNLPFDEQINA